MMAMGEFSLQVFPSDDALAAAAAAAWLDAVAAADSAHRVALSGGRVATKWFAEVVAQAATRRLDFGSVEFFWADERCVPPADPASNYRLAREGLLEPLGITNNRVHRIRGESEPEAAAAAATADLRRVASSPGTAQPVLALVLLGMGEDGHVASLFPGDEAALADHTAVFRAVRNAPKPPPCRVTLGLGALMAAREVWVLVAGKGKAPALRESLAPDGQTPLARVIQSRPATRIFACE